MLTYIIKIYLNLIIMKKNKPLVFIIGGFGTKAGIDIINNLLIEYKMGETIT